MENNKLFERKIIGLSYFYDENWVGGAYYIQNLVLAFDSLPDNEKPLVVLYSDPEPYAEFKQITRYPYLRHVSELKPRAKLLQNGLNKVSQFFFNRLIFRRTKPSVDVLFPVYEVSDTDSSPEYVYWIPDFQEHYLPEFFSTEEIEKRKKTQTIISKKKEGKLVLSSQSSMKDYTDLYPHARTKNYVIPFAVSHPPFQRLDATVIKRKYRIPIDYFMVPNQFWAHKNHRVIIDSVKLLKQRGINVFVVFTGKEYDWRKPDYFSDLKEHVVKSQVSENFYFLGLIERSEQLLLMKNAKAIIQPSKFEGWSTAVEDAKAMNQFIIASNIPVHLEQISQNVFFFNPEDPHELSNLIRKILANKPALVECDYTENVKIYAKKFLSIL